MGKNNKRFTIEEVSKAFEEKDYVLISTEYKNKNTHLDYICNKHKELGIQTVTFDSFKGNKHNCKGCKKENSIGKTHQVPKRIDNHYDEMFDAYKNRLLTVPNGNEYILKNIFIENKRTMLDLIHITCGKHYIVNQYKFFHNKNRCQNTECKSNRKSIQHIKSKSQVKQEVENLVGDEYLLSGEYTGTNNNMIFRHNIPECNYKFLMTPHNFIQGGQRCPACASKIRREKLAKTQKQYEEEIFDRFENEYTVIGNYINNRSKIKIKHNNCGHIFSIFPSKMLYNLSPCPFCERPTKGEQRIIDYLDCFMKDEYIYQKYYDGLLGINDGLLSYDFYLPQYNLLIEYQGEFHDGTVNNQTLEDFERQQEHDRRKREYAKSHGIDLLEIWYWDFDNIEDILYNYLKEKGLKKYKKSIKIKYINIGQKIHEESRKNECVFR